ncbi:hypothetical protein [Nonomuraea sp. NPDC049028]
MEGLLLSIHVLAGIVFVGGSAIAASLFPATHPLLWVRLSVTRRRSDRN